MTEDSNQGFVNRAYRSLHRGDDLEYFNISLRESDLNIAVDRASYSEDLKELCRRELARLRGELEDYIYCHPEFRTSLVPVRLLPAAPEIVRIMGNAARISGVGPMAAVAGAVAQGVGEKLKKEVQEAIVENGGDIFMDICKTRTIAVFAGKSRFSYRIGIKVKPEESPLGVCTSSGTVGPSISFGTADAVMIKGDSAALADAAASRAANMVKSESDLVKAIESVKDINGIRGVLAIKGEKMAAWGQMEIVSLE